MAVDTRGNITYFDEFPESFLIGINKLLDNPEILQTYKHFCGTQSPEFYKGMIAMCRVVQSMIEKDVSKKDVEHLILDASMVAAKLAVTAEEKMKA